MTSIEYYRLLLEGKERPKGHFMMPAIKQFCTMKTGELYGRYCQDYRVLTRCQIQIMEQYPSDTFNCMGYPYREAADCGVPIEFPEDSQPRSRGILVERIEDLGKLHWPEPKDGPLMSDRINAIREFKRLRPDIVMIGAAEFPFDLACAFMGIERTMLLLLDDPSFVTSMMDWLEPRVLQFIMAQIEAGADMAFLGDALASQVGKQLYIKYILPSEKRLTQAIQAAGVPVRVHNCGNISAIIEDVASTGARFIDIDYAVDLTHACKTVARVSPGSFVVGNLNPVTVLLQGSPDDVTAACRECDRQAIGFDNFILSPGCEVPPATPVENYQALLAFGAIHGNVYTTN